MTLYIFAAQWRRNGEDKFMLEKYGFQNGL